MEAVGAVLHRQQKKTNNGRKRSRSEEHLVDCEPNQKAVYKKAKNHRVLKKWPNCISGGVFTGNRKQSVFVRRRCCMYIEPLISPMGRSRVMKKET